MPHGIPYSVFCGRVVAPGEPAWLAEDMELALAWQREKDLTCSGCGQPVDESTAAENARAYQVNEGVCYACAALSWRQDALREGEADLAGARLYVTRKERRRD